MKVESVSIRNFKRFGDEPSTIDFRDPLAGEIPDRLVLVGDNGSGKTTVLQVIALVLILRRRTGAHINR